MNLQETKPTKKGNEENISIHDYETIYPFRIMEHTFYDEKRDEETKEYRIILGNSIVSTESFTSEEDAKKYVDSKPYELLINLICDIYQKLKNDESKQ